MARTGRALPQFCFSGDGGTPPAVCLLSQGFCPVYYFDGDFDGDIDLADHASFESCLAGPDVDRLAGCSMHDVDADYDVDLDDAATFARCFSDDGWSPASGCCQPARYYHDADFDGDVYMADYSHFTGCYNPGVEAPPDCLYPHDYDNAQSANGRVDAADNAGFWACFKGPREVPPDTCCRDEAPTKSAKPRAEAPPSGTFALHGRARLRGGAVRGRARHRLPTGEFRGGLKRCADSCRYVGGVVESG